MLSSSAAQPVLQKVVRNFQGHDVKIFLIKQGTPLPPSLTLLHEHSDHYSMQCVKSMTLNDLNSELTQFMVKHGRVLDKFQFDDEFPFSIQ
ncbi:hypothetical protein C8R43DRAFT_1136950 [Mycena crocata]|nr:hypothetical protein C8R43DRAFT_1136950 [Mycena crocata]